MQKSIIIFIKILTLAYLGKWIDISLGLLGEGGEGAGRGVEQVPLIPFPSTPAVVIIELRTHIR